MTSIILSPKEEKRRNNILSGNLWKVVPLITAPLAVYALFNYLYGFFDLIVVSFIGHNEVASIVFIDQIKTAITAFGAGIASGGTVLVARHYGAGNIAEARKNAASSFALAVLVATAVVIIVLSFGEVILRGLNAPEEVIAVGLGYFNIQMVTTGMIAINSVFIGLERAKGNTALILWLNIIAMIIKLVLTLVFVFGLGKGTEYVALATLIAQAVLMIVALGVMFNKNNSLKITFKEMRFKKTYLIPILAISIPVFTGKFLFSMGKVVVNSMAAIYGPLAVAAFGIVMKLTGGAGVLSQVFEDSETSIISQNLGNSNLKRAFNTYKIAQIYSFFIALAGMILVVFFIDRLIPIFTNVEDTVYKSMLYGIFQWEKYSIITSSAIALVTGMFIGFKMTKIAFFLNVIRLFVFRIPVLWLMQQFDIGYVALGYTMFISNLATMVIAFGFLIVFYYKTKTYGYMNMYLN